MRCAACPGWPLILFVLTYVLPGFWGREPWKTIDMGSLGVMLDLATGASPWQAPTFLGLPPDAQALLPYWLGAWVMAIAPAGWDVRHAQPLTLHPDVGTDHGCNLESH